jgi:2-polyprenyl-6-methoxyphenol hydroxylase-like FAD-dependent oxidoreductase
MRAVVLGGGVAGCAAALACARRGHDVVLVDRDLAAPVADPDELCADWDRPGIGQFRQPHNFLGLGRKVLREHFADCFSDLAALGAGEVSQAEFLGSAPREHGDADLATVACRRPVFDAVLRAGVHREATIDRRPGRAIALEVRAAGGPVPHVSGLRLETGEVVSGDLIVDAAGRNSPVPGWLSESAGDGWPERHSDSGLLYYSRHYRWRGEPLPHASILGGPRGDVGYLAFAVFLGDSKTFCLCVMAPAWEPEWRGLRDPAAFERVAELLPGVAGWLAAARPISDVLPMGQLRNTVRHTVQGERPIATGIVPIGDARCHTNPTFAFGASLGLAQAVALAETARTAAGDADLVTNFEAEVGPDTAARFDAVAAEDRDRVRLWSGEPIDPTDRRDSMPLFLRTVVYRAAAADPQILRAVCRRINLLDPVDALAQDTAMLDRAAELVADLPMPPSQAPDKATAAAALRG